MIRAGRPRGSPRPSSAARGRLPAGAAPRAARAAARPFPRPRRPWPRPAAGRRRSTSCRGLRRVPAARRPGGLADGRRTARDPARHGAHARDRQPAEGVLRRRRSALRRRRVPGQGVPIARAGSDLRRRHPACGAATPIASTDGWRGDVVAPLIRDLGVGARDEARRRGRAHGAVGADGEGGSADERQGPARRRFRRRHPSRGGAAGDRHARRLPGWRWRSRSRARGGSRCRSSARAARRWASGTRRSTSARRGGCRRSSASRTTRRRCRRRSRDQSAVRVFADKAQGYGIPGITIDGTDPDEIAAAFAWAVERAREGKGPALIELVCMRMCGHAHHDDMLYLGQGSAALVELSAADRAGLRQSRAVRRTGAPAIRSPTYAARLEGDGVIAAGRRRSDPGRGRGARRRARRAR